MSSADGCIEAGYLRDPQGRDALVSRAAAELPCEYRITLAREARVV